MAKTKKSDSRWNLKKTICAILVFVSVIACVGGIAALTKNDTKTIGSGAFEVGSINEETGAFVKSETTLYTSDLIECKGLEITPDFDSTVKYQIFWYNEDEFYIGCTKKTTGVSEVFKNAVPTLAVFARIVIFPCDESGREIDEKIEFYEKRGIVNSLEITVNKKQDYDAVNLFEVAMSNSKESPEETLSKGMYYLEGYHYFGFDENNVAIENYSDTCVKKMSQEGFAVIKTDCNVVKEYIFKYAYVEGEYIQHIFFFDSTGKLTNAGDIVRLSPVKDGQYRVSIPSNATYMLVNVGNTLSEFGIYEYIPRNSITEKLY